MKFKKFICFIGLGTIGAKLYSQYDDEFRYRIHGLIRANRVAIAGMKIIYQYHSVKNKIIRKI